MCMNIFQDWNG